MQAFSAFCAPSLTFSALFALIHCDYISLGHGSSGLACGRSEEKDDDISFEVLELMKSGSRPLIPKSITEVLRASF